MRAALVTLALLAATPAAAIPFEIGPLIGGGGYLDDGLAYTPGFAVGAGMGLRPLPWLRVEAHVLLNPLGIERDPVFQVDDPEALLALYGLHIGARVLTLGPVELLVGPHLGGFVHSVGGDDGFSTVTRRASGLAWGALIDGGWRLTTAITASLRVQYSRIHPTEICLDSDGSERCREALPDEEQASAHLTALAGLWFSF